MEDSKVVSVAIQGEEGSYHDKAARHYFGANYVPRYCKTFEEVFASVTEGQTAHGLSAVENSLVGSIVPVYDLLRTVPKVRVVGEIFLGIHHSLIGLPGAKLSDITDVYSHPVAIDQCRKFLKQELPTAVTHTASDTAGSVSLVKELGNITNAAIASADNATRLGLHVLHEGIEDNSKNYTRFLVLGKSDQDPATRREEADKTSLFIERLTDKVEEIAPGTLHAALGCFANNGISLTKIESRPIQGEPWRYVFYIDCLAGAQEPRMQAALQALDNLGSTWRLLGTYKAGQTIE